MFVVIFEVQPRIEEWETYLGLGKLLRPELEQIEGFIDNERFASRKRAGRVLSLSTWRDEKALVRWRTLAVHHDAQEQGRSRVFADYHLRVGEVTADSQAPEGQSLRQERFDTTAVGRAQLATITEAPPGTVLPASPVYESADGLVDWEGYASITTPGKSLWLASWRDEAASVAWHQTHPASAACDPMVRSRVVRIIRDYGMRDRREAPQYYPPIPLATPTPHGDRSERGAR